MNKLFEIMLAWSQRTGWLHQTMSDLCSRYSSTVARWPDLILRLNKILQGPKATGVPHSDIRSHIWLINQD